MKNKLILFPLTLLMTLFVVSCGEEDLVEYEGGTIQEVADPYLVINTSVVPVDVLEPNFTVSFDAINGSKTINQVEVLSRFTDATKGITSDPVVLKTYDIPAQIGRTDIVDSFTYAQLAAGITIEGQPLPSDPGLLSTGSNWQLSFVGKGHASGDIPLNGGVVMGVLSPFAGLYRVLESDYYRINVQSGIADWTGQERFIGSVDETTFSYNNYWGPFAWSGSSFNIAWDPNTDELTVPIVNSSGLFSGNRALRCDTEEGLFVDVPCAGSNMLVRDGDLPTGKHRFVITYGYFTDGSGSRQFYEVLEKIQN